MGLRIVWHQGDVRTAQDHRNPTMAEHCGELVGPRRCAGDHRYADDVGVEIGWDVVNPFVDKKEIGFEVGWR